VSSNRKTLGPTIPIRSGVGANPELSSGALSVPVGWRRAGACPLPDHDDAYASCQVYAEAEQGWWCFGCQRGGRIYDLASLLAGGAWGRDLRGEAFKVTRELVAAGLRCRGSRAG
jgi:hypothetical protein